MVQKSLLILAATLLVLAGLSVGLVLADQKTSLPLPSALRTRIRETIGYCIDGNQIYWRGAPPFLPPDSPCVVCACNPQADGVSCKFNREPAECRLVKQP